MRVFGKLLEVITGKTVGPGREPAGEAGLSSSSELLLDSELESSSATEGGVSLDSATGTSESSASDESESDDDSLSGSGAYPKPAFSIEIYRFAGVKTVDSWASSIASIEISRAFFLMAVDTFSKCRACRNIRMEKDGN